MVKINPKKRQSKKSKKAMSLVALLFSLALLSILVGMFIPVLTKGYIQITTGKGGIGKINLTTSNGYFMCYYEANGVLTQARADIAHTGEVNLQKEAAPDSGCRFVIPTRADSFKITLIGGGGGGAASDIKTVDKILSTAYLSGKNGKFSIPDFTDWLSYVTNNRINKALSALFSNNVNDSQYAYLCLKGSNGKKLGNVNGSNGAACMVRFNAKPSISTYNSFTYGSSVLGNSLVYSDNYLLKFAASSAVAHGGASAMTINGITSSPEQYISNCCTGSGTGCPESFLELCSKTNNDASGTGICKVSGEDLSVSTGGVCTTATQSSINFVAGSNLNSFNLSNNFNIPLNLKRREFVKYIAESGSSGAVETHTVSFISPNSGADTLQIPAEWLGVGGLGGNQAGNNNSSGTAGGETKIELAVAGSSTPMVITAAGGVGGSMQEDIQRIMVVSDETALDSTSDFIVEGTIAGDDGKFPRDIIPQPLRITMLSPGLGIVDCKSTSCDVEVAATYPGAGGGAAGAYYSGYNQGAAPRITFSYSAALTDYVLASANNDVSGVPAPVTPELKSGKGGNGARGAILISW